MAVSSLKRPSAIYAGVTVTSYNEYGSFRHADTNQYFIKLNQAWRSSVNTWK